MGQEGPPHQPCFTMAAIVDGHELGRGEGRSKHEATIRAAAEAYQALLRAGEAGPQA